MSSPRSGHVALVGWTNVGKSTLLNRLVGTKLAAVADAAQTTRGRIIGVVHEPRGQIVFVDTPGIHRPRHRLNRAMVDTARRAVQDVDVVLVLVDASRGLQAGDLQVIEHVSSRGGSGVLALNKTDLVSNKSLLLPMIARGAQALGTDDVVPISARTGEGCDELLGVLFRRLPQGPPLFPEDYLTDQPERALAAEWIREKLLDATRQELPHATAVLVERWHQREDGLLEIEATVVVERESQKRIVIGTGGELLKRVGVQARAELEAFLERQVFLRLWVQVRRGWRDDARALRRLGLD